MVSSLHVETAVHMGACVRAYVDRAYTYYLIRIQITHITNTAEAITGVRFTQREEGDGGALVLEVAEGMAFTAPG
jgi:hypothetical protein